MLRIIQVELQWSPSLTDIYVVCSGRPGSMSNVRFTITNGEHPCRACLDTGLLRYSTCIHATNTGCRHVSDVQSKHGYRCNCRSASVVFQAGRPTADGHSSWPQPLTNSCSVPTRRDPIARTRQCMCFTTKTRHLNRHGHLGEPQPQESNTDSQSARSKANNPGAGRVSERVTHFEAGRLANGLDHACPPGHNALAVHRIDKRVGRRDGAEHAKDGEVRAVRCVATQERPVAHCTPTAAAQVEV